MVAVKTTEERSDSSSRKNDSFHGKKKMPLSLASTLHENNKIHSYMDLLRTRQALKLTASTVFMFLVIPLLYCSIINKSMNIGGDMYVDFAVATTADLPALFGATVLMQKMGRKFVSVGGILLAAVMAACMMLVPATLTYLHAVMMTMTFVGKLSISSGKWSI